MFGNFKIANRIIITSTIIMELKKIIKAIIVIYQQEQEYLSSIIIIDLWIIIIIKTFFIFISIYTLSHSLSLFLCLYKTNKQNIHCIYICESKHHVQNRERERFIDR